MHIYSKNNLTKNKSNQFIFYALSPEKKKKKKHKKTHILKNIKPPKQPFEFYNLFFVGHSLFDGGDVLHSDFISILHQDEVVLKLLPLGLVGIIGRHQTGNLNHRKTHEVLNLVLKTFDSFSNLTKGEDLLTFSFMLQPVRVLHAEEFFHWILHSGTR